MLKSRFYMGLGAGIVIGALLLQLLSLGDAARSQQNVSDSAGMAGMDGEDTLSEQQLRQAAERLSFRLIPADEKVYTQADLDEALAQQAAQLEEEAERASHDIEYAFYIRRAMNLTEVAEMLADFGLIEDPAAFIDKMRGLSYSTRIQIGAFTFKGKPTEDELIRVITTTRPR